MGKGARQRAPPPRSAQEGGPGDQHPGKRKQGPNVIIRGRWALLCLVPPRGPVCRGGPCRWHKALDNLTPMITGSGTHKPLHHGNLMTRGGDLLTLTIKALLEVMMTPALLNLINILPVHCHWIKTRPRHKHLLHTSDTDLLTNLCPDANTIIRVGARDDIFNVHFPTSFGCPACLQMWMQSQMVVFTHICAHFLLFMLYFRSARASQHPLKISHNPEICQLQVFVDFIIGHLISHNRDHPILM